MNYKRFYKGKVFRVQIVSLLIAIVLLMLPFFDAIIENYVISPVISSFALPRISVNLLRFSTASLLFLSISAFLGNSYGLEITKKLRKILGIMLLLFILIGYFFLITLKTKGFFDELAAMHLVNWIISVFREEFLLRGVIQTEASYILKGKFLKISNAIWLTTIAFSTWHLVNLTVWPWQTVALQMLAAIPSGIILGLIKEKTGNTLLTYLLHICGDLLFFSIYLLLFGRLFFTLF